LLSQAPSMHAIRCIPTKKTNLLFGAFSKAGCRVDLYTQEVSS
jgi:hypothetical protein